MSKKLKVLVLFFSFLVFWLFYYVNEVNYLKIKEKKQNIIVHPELLPKKDFAKYTSFWFSNLKADIYWLETIQYIWWNVIWSEYKKYLYSMIDLITELNPFFEKPYFIWQILLPNYNETYEHLNKTQKQDLEKQAEQIWLKWMKNLCNQDKIKKILNQENILEIWNKEEFKNPCKTSQISANQAFIYYYYLKDSLKSSNFYKIASANDDVFEWAKIMSAIMRWKSWDREKSILMFITFAWAQKNEKCDIFYNYLQKLSFQTFQNNINLSSNDIKNLEELRKKYLPFWQNDKMLDSWVCENYINKAIREFNLYYIETANNKYFEKFNKNALNTQELKEKWFLEFVPTDFQQYDNRWIIYEFNKDTNKFDYKMIDK